MKYGFEFCPASGHLMFRLQLVPPAVRDIGYRLGVSKRSMSTQSWIAALGQHYSNRGYKTPMSQLEGEMAQLFSVKTRYTDRSERPSVWAICLLLTPCDSNSRISEAFRRALGALPLYLPSAFALAIPSR